MTRLLGRLVAAGLTVLAVSLTTSLTAAAGAGRAATADPPVSADRVLIVSYPRLTWELVEAVQPPVLMELLRRAAVASMSVQTVQDTTDAEDGYLTLGAGNRASVDLADVTVASSPVDGVVVDPVQQEQRWPSFGAEPGALGEALREAGRTSAVVANADISGPQGVVPHREAALAMMDAAGRAGGSVGANLAAVDAAAPGDRRQDDASMLAAFEDAWGRGAAVLVEMSDLDRADRAGNPADLAEALQRSDQMLAELLSQVDPARDVVLVVAPVAPEDRAELTVFALAGPGVQPGRARSPTTRRDGYVTLTDVAPTVLRALGVSLPDSMTGTPITSTGGMALDAAEARHRADLDARSEFRERTVVGVSVAFLLLQLAAYVAAAMLFGRPRARPFLRLGLVAVLAYPGLTLLSALVPYDRLGALGYVACLLVGALLIASVAVALSRRGPLLAPLAVVGATWVLVVVDAALGGPLQFDTPFGYSPITAARFAGMGNLGFALLMVSSIVLATGAWPTWPSIGTTPEPVPARAPMGLLALAATGFVIAVAVDGLPRFGADIGGVLAMVPALGTCWLLLSGRRLSWWRLVAVGATAVLLVVAFAGLDLTRPADERTHLGRFAQRVLDGEAWPTLERKLVTNVQVLVNPGVILATVVGVLAAVAAWRSPVFGQLRQRVPGVGAAVVASLVGAVLGFGVNDSGIVVPGMMLAVLVPWFVHLAFEVDDRGAA